LSANDEPAASNSAGRKGCVALLVILAVIIGVVIFVVRLWPKSEVARQREAVEACRTAVENRVSTKRPKRWSTVESFTVHGDGYIVESAYDASGEAASFVCVVDGDGNVSDLTVDPH